MFLRPLYPRAFRDLYFDFIFFEMFFLNRAQNLHRYVCNKVMCHVNKIFIWQGTHIKTFISSITWPRIVWSFRTINSQRLYWLCLTYFSAWVQLVIIIKRPWYITFKFYFQISCLTDFETLRSARDYNHNSLQKRGLYFNKKNITKYAKTPTFYDSKGTSYLKNY